MSIRVHSWLPLLLIGLTPPARAATSGLPPIDGELRGDLVPFSRSDLSLHWSVNSATPAAGQRELHVALTGQGAELIGEAHVAEKDGRGTWQIARGTLDLATWFAVLSERYAPALSGTEAKGSVQLNGQGALAYSLQHYDGELRLSLAKVSLENSATKWSVHGVAGEIVFPHLPAWASAPQQRVTFSDGEIGELPLRNGLWEITVESPQRIQVHRLRLEALGGVIASEAFAIDLAQMQARAVVHVQNLDLSALQAYLPPSIAEVHGRVDGQVEILWSAKDGVQIGAGRLAMKKESEANLRLAPAPGFLSSHVPANYNLLPEWMGKFLVKASSQRVPAHDELVAIEMGREQLIVDSIDAELQPQNEGGGTTARVRIEAHPRNTTAVKTVRLNVNVSGPLADVVRMGLSGRLSFGS